MPQESGDKNSSNKKSCEKRAKKPNQNFRPGNRDSRKKAEVIIVIFGLIEILSLVLWQSADVFHKFSDIIHWLSLCGFIAGAAYLLDKVFNHNKWVWILYMAACALLGLAVYENSEPSPLNRTESKSVEEVENSTTPLQANKPEPQAALQTLAEKLETTSDQLRQATQGMANLEAANEALMNAQSATQARRITPQQRENFIKILSDAHNVSKIPIKVIVGRTDGETENFALQFREMLDEAGYGTVPSGLQAPLNDPSFKGNILYVTDALPNIKIPMYNESGKYEEIIRIPNLYATPTSGSSQKGPDVIAIFSSTNGTMGIPSMFPDRPTIMPMHATTNNPGGGVVYAYSPAQNPDKILLGVMEVLIDDGISTSAGGGKTFLKPGEIAFFIPQKLY